MHEDRNTKFFCACASQRRRKNLIKCIKTDSNHTFDKVKDIEEALHGFFLGLFTTLNPSNSDIGSYTNNIGPQVTEKMNQKLNLNFTREEVEIVLKQITPLKAPKLDGFGVVFLIKNTKKL